MALLARTEEGATPCGVIYQISPAPPSQTAFDGCECLTMRSRRERKPGPDIPEWGFIDAYALIVDLNGFTSMVRSAEAKGGSAAQFVRDVLAGAIEEVEFHGGEVVGFMGDAILGVITSGEDVVSACFGIADDLDRQCEYISNAQRKSSDLFSLAPVGPSLKIAIEFGSLDVSSIESRLLGQQRLFVGTAINHASRIAAAGVGNRCLVGPAAAREAFSSYGLEGPYSIVGKPGEPPYEYYNFSMGDVWIEGPREDGKDTSWR